ncbi:MAG: DUF1737 domain-containing protein [Alphaproteobacteria bacterium]|nr:DUF1737 domain-containing protein [Alphaproteobacteria bacterium]
MTKEYKLIACRTITELEDTVSLYIRRGYKPTGGVTLYEEWMLQAVYKEIEI